ncbi:di-trans,poly-cis-decaprenylcistransferase [Pseudorhizobium halotolerans]|uniref:Di-trans,poly-cis-decaprenylcistransferase n=1 Tax=Pseudorhizobium halotolerans TaxID=1233081 RepID=A0ABM8PWS1_9HYPH|nr:glycoside hydrolase family 88 protein [Pseudorhizobium halotolerans]CAD7052538.1 di-trans,poly-cis-decaprenylcistransferase [Pseudorhizobium halotolerans]
MMYKDYFDHFCQRYDPYKDGAWCYEDGCIYRGLMLLYQSSGEPRWLDHLMRMVPRQVQDDGALVGYDPREFNIDNILPGRVLLFLDRETKDARYMAAARRLIGQLDDHPRLLAGNYWHKARYPHQVWLDGLYMALPFQVEYALAANEQPRITDALQQLATALVLTAAPGGLHVHGYDESRQQAWADKETGKSPAVWARAMGWMVMTLVDVLAVLPNDAATKVLRKRTRSVLLAILQHQQESGLWLQVLDTPDLVGNYEETSASAMFAYASLAACRLQLLAPEETRRLENSARRALDALLGTRLLEEDGLIRLTGICQVAGLGALSGPYRDGTPAYYLSEPVVADDAKGVGPLMMAVAELELAAAAAGGHTIASGSRR